MSLHFEIWFQVPNLATFEAAAKTEAIHKFHDELEEYIDLAFRPSSVPIPIANSSVLTSALPCLGSRNDSGE
jgi:hypothetical protein